MWSSCRHFWMAFQDVSDGGRVCWIDREADLAVGQTEGFEVLDGLAAFDGSDVCGGLDLRVGDEINGNGRVCPSEIVNGRVCCGRDNLRTADRGGMAVTHRGYRGKGDRGCGAFWRGASIAAGEDLQRPKHTLPRIVEEGLEGGGVGDALQDGLDNHRVFHIERVPEGRCVSFAV